MGSQWRQAQQRGYGGRLSCPAPYPYSTLTYMVVVDSSSESTFRPVRVTWPFIVIYTIINDTGHQRKKDLRRFGEKQLSPEDSSGGAGEQGAYEYSRTKRFTSGLARYSTDWNGTWAHHWFFFFHLGYRAGFYSNKRLIPAPTNFISSHKSIFIAVLHISLIEISLWDVRPQSRF